MPKYTAFWQSIIKTIKAELNTSEPYQNQIINWELPEIGQRKSYNGYIDVFAFAVRNRTQSQVFVDLHTVLEEDKKWLKQLGGQLEIRVKNNTEINIAYKPFSWELMMNRYRDYQDKTQMEDELYKWALVQKFQDQWKDYEAGRISFQDLFLNLDYSNLVYHRSKSIWTALATEKPSRFEEAVIGFFNEENDLQLRIDRFRNEIIELTKTLRNKKFEQKSQEERAFATLLTFRYPEKYTFYLDSFYTPLTYCLSQQPKEPWKKLVHYYQIVNDFKENVLHAYEDVIAVKNRLTEEPKYYPDEQHLLLIQDIFYVTLMKGLPDDDKEMEGEVDSEEDFDGMFGEVVRQLDPQKFQEYISTLRFFVKKHNLNREDKRLGFTVPKGEIRLNFIINSRYSLSIFKEKGNTNFGLIYKEPLAKNSGEFVNAGKLEAYWSVVEELPVYKEKALEGCKIELDRNRDCPYRDYNNQEFMDAVFNDNQTNAKPMPLNSILFGPPGTGKTYNTVAKALEICGIDTDAFSREELKVLFTEKVEAGQIVFTTFHQSMTYEDFVEGIKPLEPEKEGDPVIYKVEQGVFKQISTDAAFEFARVNQSKTTEQVLDFSGTYNQYIEELEERLSEGREVELATRNGGVILVDSLSSQGNVIVKHRNGTRTYTVSKQRLTKLHKAFEDLGEVNNINDEFRSIIGGSNSSAYWAVLNDIRKKTNKVKSAAREASAYAQEEKIEAIRTLTNVDYQNPSVKPYVLIIDEINRGNVSQIFGELITLLEEDKRLGNTEYLEVTLPYSKDRFGVPPNLFVIGTMNTADRSVEALDAALRRRFSFVEMPPRYDLEELNTEVAGISLRLLLETINARIEKLLDKDHKIGHAYFLGVKNEADLSVVFRDKIIPLLQEYFFGDYGKIGLVLSGSFATPDGESFIGFSDFEYDDPSAVEDFKARKVYKITEPSSWEFDTIVTGKSKTA
jgi:hypothetical protein